MPTPLLLADYGPTGTSTNQTQTTSVTVAPGDVLVAWAETSVHTRTINTPTGGTGLTWLLRQSIVGVTSYCNVYVWTARATTAQTFTLSMSSSGTDPWGMGVLRWTQVVPGTAFLGAMAKQNNLTNQAPSLSITTLEAGSALMLFVADWEPVSGTNRAYRLPAGAEPIIPGGNGEAHYSFTSGEVTCYVGYHETAGAAGAKTVGLTAPTGQKPSMIAVELLGAAPGIFVDLDGEGTLTAESALRGVAALGGEGTLTAESAPEVTRAAGMSGGGTLSARPVRDVSFAGTGTLSATTRPVATLVAGLSGSGTLRPRYKEAAPTGAGTLTATVTWRLAPLTWPVEGSFYSDGVFVGAFISDGITEGVFASDGIGVGSFAY